MESTGVLLEAGLGPAGDDVECWLLNAQHRKNVPGRRTEVADAAWIAQLVEHGLVRPSFEVARPIRQLGELTRYRKALLHEGTREAQRLAKVLEDAGTEVLRTPVPAPRANAERWVGTVRRELLDRVLIIGRDMSRWR